MKQWLFLARLQFSNNFRNFKSRQREIARKQIASSGEIMDVNIIAAEDLNFYCSL